MQLDRDVSTFHVGELIAAYARRRFQRDTVKAVARAWGLDLSAAENLIRGSASSRTITKAIRAEGWALLEALGLAVTGETYAQHLQGLANEQQQLATRAAARADHLRALEARAARMVDGGGGSLSL